MCVYRQQPLHCRSKNWACGNLASAATPHKINRSTSSCVPMYAHTHTHYTLLISSAVGLGGLSAPADNILFGHAAQSCRGEQDTRHQYDFHRKHWRKCFLFVSSWCNIFILNADLHSDHTDTLPELVVQTRTPVWIAAWGGGCTDVDEILLPPSGLEQTLGRRRLRGEHSGERTTTEKWDTPVTLISSSSRPFTEQKHLRGQISALLWVD